MPNRRVLLSGLRACVRICSQHSTVSNSGKPDPCGTMYSHEASTEDSATLTAIRRRCRAELSDQRDAPGGRLYYRI